MYKKPPARFDLLNNEPGQALTRPAIAASGTVLGDTSWHKGAEGEEFTSNCLESIRGRGWFVVDSIPLAHGGDIDHLAIGSPGVFVINSKHFVGAHISTHGGSLFINGTRRDGILKEVKKEAKIASEVIERRTGVNLHVVPVLAFVKPGSVKGSQEVKGVRVGESEHIVQTLEADSQERLLASHVVLLTHALRDSRVWSD